MASPCLLPSCARPCRGPPLSVPCGPSALCFRLSAARPPPRAACLPVPVVWSPLLSFSPRLPPCDSVPSVFISSSLHLSLFLLPPAPLSLSPSGICLAPRTSACPGLVSMSLCPPEPVRGWGWGCLWRRVCRLLGSSCRLVAMVTGSEGPAATAEPWAGGGVGTHGPSCAPCFQCLWGARAPEVATVPRLGPQLPRGLCRHFWHQ